MVVALKLFHESFYGDFALSQVVFIVDLHAEEDAPRGILGKVPRVKEHVRSPLHVGHLKGISKSGRIYSLAHIGSFLHRNAAFVRGVVIPLQLQGFALEVANFKGSGDAAVFAVLANEGAIEGIWVWSRGSELSLVH